MVSLVYRIDHAAGYSLENSNKGLHVTLWKNKYFVSIVFDLPSPLLFILCMRFIRLEQWYMVETYYSGTLL